MNEENAGKDVFVVYCPRMRAIAYSLNKLAKRDPTLSSENGWIEYLEDKSSIICGENFFGELPSQTELMIDSNVSYQSIHSDSLWETAGRFEYLKSNLSNDVQWKLTDESIEEAEGRLGFLWAKIEKLYESDFLLYLIKNNSSVEKQFGSKFSKPGFSIERILNYKVFFNSKIKLKLIRSVERAFFRYEAWQLGYNYITNLNRETSLYKPLLDDIFFLTERLSLTLFGCRSLSDGYFKKNDEYHWIKNALELIVAFIDGKDAQIGNQLREKLNSLSIHSVVLWSAFNVYPNDFKELLISRVEKSIGGTKRFDKIVKSLEEGTVLSKAMIGNRTVLGEDISAINFWNIVRSSDRISLENVYTRTIFDQALSYSGYDCSEMTSALEEWLKSVGGIEHSSLLLAKGYKAFLDQEKGVADQFFSKAIKQNKNENFGFYHFNNGVRTFISPKNYDSEILPFTLKTSNSDLDLNKKYKVLCIGADDGYFSKFYNIYLNSIIDGLSVLEDGSTVVVSCAIVQPSAESLLVIDELCQAAKNIDSLVLDFLIYDIPGYLEDKGFYTCLRFVSLNEIVERFENVKSYNVISTDVDIKFGHFSHTFSHLEDYDLGVRLAGNPSNFGLNLKRGRPWMINAQTVFYSKRFLSALAPRMYKMILSKFPSHQDLWMVDQACLRRTVDLCMEELHQIGAKPKVRNLMRGYNTLESSGWNKDAFAAATNVTNSCLKQRMSYLK